MEPPSKLKKTRTSWNPIKMARARSFRKSRTSTSLDTSTPSLGSVTSILGGAIAVPASDLSEAEVSSVYSKESKATLGTVSTPSTTSPAAVLNEQRFPEEKELVDVKRILVYKEPKNEGNDDNGMETVLVRGHKDEAAVVVPIDVTSHCTNHERTERQIRRGPIEGMTVGGCSQQEMSEADTPSMTALGDALNEAEVADERAAVRKQETERPKTTLGPRGQIQYSEEESVQMGDGTEVERSPLKLGGKIHYGKGKRFFDRHDSHTEYFEEIGPKGQRIYLEDEDRQDSDSDDDSDSDGSEAGSNKSQDSSSVVLSSSFVSDTDQNTTANFQENGGGCCFMCTD